MGDRLYRIGQVVTGWIVTLSACSFAMVVCALTFRQLSHHIVPRLLNVYGRLMLWVSRVELVVEGREHLEGEGAAVLVFNHTSLLDVFLITAVMPRRASCVGKKEMLRIPILGQAFWLMGFALVDRGDSARAHASLERMTRRMRRLGLRVVVAPEGTRTRTGEMGSFKLGAFHMAMDTGAPIVPIAVAGAFAIHPYGRWSTTPGRVVIRALPSMDTAHYERDNLREAAEAVRGRISDALDRVYQDHPALRRHGEAP